MYSKLFYLIFMVLCQVYFANGIYWTVTVYTGTASNSGTDSDIDISVAGTEGTMGYTALSGSFENGDVDTTSFYASFGKPYRIQLRHDGSGIASGWKLNKVVMSSSLGSFYFYCDCWLDGETRTIDSHSPVCKDIPRCKSGQMYCRSSIHDSICHQCIDPYYGPGYGRGCQPCPTIQKCTNRFCSSSSDVTCRTCEHNNIYYKVSSDGRRCDVCPNITKCVDQYCRTGMHSTKCRTCEDNVFYKVSVDNTRCDRMCAWNNHYCWPGTCGDGLVKNCHCSWGFHLISTASETSCQLCKDIPRCKSGQMYCRSSIHDSICHQCIDPYYGPGYGWGCQPCPTIQKCTNRFCSSSSDVTCRTCEHNNIYYKVSSDGRRCDVCPNITKCVDQYCRTGMHSTKCRTCEDNNVFYKVSVDNTRCDRMCAWNNHYCWPGTCGDGLVKNCHCSWGFHLISTASETSCQLQRGPTFETCSTRTLILGGKMVMSKTVGNTTACQNQKDYYGNFKPDQHHFNVLARFSVDTRRFPPKPTYIKSYNFGITDFTVDSVLRRIGAPERILHSLPLRKDTSHSKNVVETFTDERSLGVKSVSLQSGDRTFGRVDWSDVFDDNPEIPTTYGLIVGSQDGYGDEKFGMTSFSHSFRVPKASSIITKYIQELSMTITAVYATGMKSEYKTSYKLA